MTPELNESLIALWEKYFGSAELPSYFFYTDGDRGAEWASKPSVKG